MYHIKDDPRAEKSSELLFEGLMRCMGKKPFDKITVTDITQMSTVSRATFYRNFDSVVDILYWKSDRLFHQVLTAFCAQDIQADAADSLILFVFRFWMEHSEILETLIEQKRIDIIFNSFLNNAPIVSRHLKENYGAQVPDSSCKMDYRYFIAIRAGVFVGIFQSWIENGKKETAQELAQMIEQQFSAVSRSIQIF